MIQEMPQQVQERPFAFNYNLAVNNNTNEPQRIVDQNTNNDAQVLNEPRVTE